MFCEFWRNHTQTHQRTQRRSVKSYPEDYPGTLGIPWRTYPGDCPIHCIPFRRHTLLPYSLERLQEALWPMDFRRPPYSLERPPCGPTYLRITSPQAEQTQALPSSPQHTLASGTGIPMVPSIHSIQEGPRGQTTRLQDTASQQKA